MSAYYNEIEPFAAQWLRNLIQKGLILDGEVDTRSIVDVQPLDLRGFTQCHFFAGIGGWSHALRLAGWPDDRPVWTGSCPCQPFSTAGRQLGTLDPRHLWPHFHRLIAAVRPPVVFGEQVSGAAGYGWLDGVRSDLAGENYACEGFDIPACAVDAPHIRQRLYWVATNMGDSNVPHGERSGLSGGVYSEYHHTHGGSIYRDSDMADANNERRDGIDALLRPDASGWNTEGVYEAAGCSSGNMADAGKVRCGWRSAHTKRETRPDAGVESSSGTFWSDHIWLTGADGKARRAQPGISLLVDGLPARVGRLRAYGNAIVPQLAAEVIGAFMEAR